VPTGRALPRQVRKSHLAERRTVGEAGSVPELRDREVLDAILTCCQYTHVKLDLILDLLEEDGEEEEEDEAAG
jgi:hypothetical protein